jgi:hypothetical protein
MKNHLNYFGLTKPTLIDATTGLSLASPFICISEVNLFDWMIEWTYEVFKDAAHFDNDGKPISDLRKTFRSETDEFESFKGQNEGLFDLLDARFRLIVQPAPSVSGSFQSAHFRTLDYVLNIFFTDGDDFPMRRLKGDAYHTNIASNLDVIGFDANNSPGLIPVLHSFGATKDAAFFADTTLVLP